MINTYFEDDAIKGKSIDWKIVKFLWKFNKKYKALLFLSILLSLGTSGILIAIPSITALVIDKGVQDSNIAAVIKFGMILLYIRLAHFVFLGLQLYFMQVLGAKVIHDLRVFMFKHVQKLPVSYFDKNPVGRVVTRLSNDVAAIGELFSEGVAQILLNLIYIFGAMGWIIFLNWRLGLLSLITFPFLAIIGYKIAILLRDSKRKVREKLAAINSFLSEHISGMRVVNMFSQEERILKKFADKNDDYMVNRIAQMKLYAILMPVVTVLTGISIALILWYGGYLVHNGHLSIGFLVAFISYIQWILHPLRDMIERYNIFLQSSTATERLYKISLLDEENKEEERVKLDNVEGLVEFRSVCFKYEANKEVLKNISFKINKGERVALVGHTGCGKTTTLNLLNKFYTPQKGDILIDGKNIKSIDRESLRSFIGKIDQNVHIFSGTIRDNIAMGRDMSNVELDRALDTSNCRKILKKFKEGLDYKITEAGKNLSFGERQLISFARLVAYDPAILIMDEATSNIDSENEKFITEAIEKITRGRTSIIVAHRLSTVTKCDQIYVVDHGEIIEAGTHGELLRAEGKYAMLYENML